MTLTSKEQQRLEERYERWYGVSPDANLQNFWDFMALQLESKLAKSGL